MSSSHFNDDIPLRNLTHLFKEIRNKTPVKPLPKFPASAQQTFINVIGDLLKIFGHEFSIGEGIGQIEGAFSTTGLDKN